MVILIQPYGRIRWKLWQLSISRLSEAVLLYRSVPVSVVGFGNVAFIGMGGEPFTQYTWNSHKVAAGKTVFCSCCTNGYEGYFPHARAFAEGGYEASSSPFTTALEQEYVDVLTNIFKKF